jgi:hypothetical protein
MRHILLAVGLLLLATRASSAAVPPAPAAWTASSEAPKGLLTPVEVKHHDFFIDLARSASSCTRAPLRENCKPGGIDVVFFGSTFAEGWWWPVGMPTWSEHFATRKAVNFGSQGSRPDSLLWRMRNGELDGYSAKLVVFWLPSIDLVFDRESLDAAYGPIIAEIRARQPQARVLVFGTRPDVQASASFIDNVSVFYVSAPDLRAPNTDDYRARADQLEPWLKRFVD